MTPTLPKASPSTCKTRAFIFIEPPWSWPCRCPRPFGSEEENSLEEDVAEPVKDTVGRSSKLVCSWGASADAACLTLRDWRSSCSYGGLVTIPESGDHISSECRVRDLCVRSAGTGEELRAILLAVCTKDALVAAGWPYNDE